MAGFVWHHGHLSAAELADKTGVTDTQALIANHTFQAKPRRAMDFFSRQRCAAKGTGDRVFGAVFQRGSQRQALVATELAERANQAQRQTPFGERASLVENHRVNLVQAFQHMAARQQ
ncbi:hypothetical protein D3C87_1263310 [compost metagenome]